MSKFIESLKRLQKAVAHYSPNMTRVERATMIMGFTEMLQILKADQNRDKK